MKFNIPSYSKIICIFILTGPFIWVLPFQLIIYYSSFENIFNFKFTEFPIDLINLILAPFTLIPAGGVAWWIRAIQSDSWLITWIPTILAALVYGYFLKMIVSKLNTFKSRKSFAVFCALLSASVSASMYSLTAFISSQLTKQDLNSHGNVNYLEYKYIITVFIVGFILGLIVGFFPKITPENIISEI